MSFGVPHSEVGSLLVTTDQNCLHTELESSKSSTYQYSCKSCGAGVRLIANPNAIVRGDSKVSNKYRAANESNISRRKRIIAAVIGLVLIAALVAMRVGGGNLFGGGWDGSNVGGVSDSSNVGGVSSSSNAGGVSDSSNVGGVSGSSNAGDYVTASGRTIMRANGLDAFDTAGNSISLSQFAQNYMSLVETGLGRQPTANEISISLEPGNTLYNRLHWFFDDENAITVVGLEMEKAALP